MKINRNRRWSIPRVTMVIAGRLFPLREQPCSSLHCYLSPHHYLYRELPGGILSAKANVTCFSRKSSKKSQLKRVKLHRPWVDFQAAKCTERSLCTWESRCGDIRQSYRLRSTPHSHWSCHDAIFVMRGRAHFFDVMLIIRAQWIKFPRLNHAVKPVYPLVMTCALVTDVAVCIVLSFCSTMTSAGRSNEYNLGRWLLRFSPFNSIEVYC